MPNARLRDMDNVTSMSREREGIAPPAPSAAVWKASRYRLVSNKHGFPQYVEAHPNATWRRVDPFLFYSPLSAVGRSVANVPHVSFSKLASMWRSGGAIRKGRTEKRFRSLHTAMAVFASTYGLLGLFHETFEAPVLPSRANHLSWLAPDAVIGRDGRMHAIDPATDGKERLARLIDLRDPRSGDKESFQEDMLVFPSELLFPPISFTPFGLLPGVFRASGSETWTWEGVKDLYGIRALLDEDAGLSHVSIVSTREPLLFWRPKLDEYLRSASSAEALNSGLEGVTPRAVAGENGELRSSWYCPSLLKAIYVMLYLDRSAGGQIRECQAPNCFEHYREGPRSRPSMYCPAPPGKKQSPCASRASSRAHRERKRRRFDTT